MLWYGVRLCIRVGRETSKNRHLRCLDLDLESDSRIGENNTHVRSLEDRKKTRIRFGNKIPISQHWWRQYFVWSYVGRRSGPIRSTRRRRSQAGGDKHTHRKRHTSSWARRIINASSAEARPPICVVKACLKQTKGLAPAWTLLPAPSHSKPHGQTATSYYNKAK